MKYFDLHCDTLTELYNKGLSFFNRQTHVNGYTVAGFSSYRQVFAVWSDPSYHPEESYSRFCSIVERIESFGLDKKDIILAVEGGSLLNGKLERVESLRQKGVLILTLMWKGNWCTGGAFDTSDGLSDFGVDTVKECFNVGIVPDLSHASDKSFFDVVRLAERYGKPVIASHSNSRGVYNHKRNMTDEMFGLIRQLGGVVGISAYPGHLTDGKCTTETMLRHIDRYMELGGEDVVCLGCDFDGIETTPENLRNPGELENLYLELDKRGYGENIINKIFFENANRFFSKLL